MFGRCGKCKKGIFLDEVLSDCIHCPRCEVLLDKRKYRIFSYFMFFSVVPLRLFILEDIEVPIPENIFRAIAYVGWFLLWIAGRCVISYDAIENCYKK